MEGVLVAGVGELKTLLKHGALVDVDTARRGRVVLKAVEALAHERAQRVPAYAERVAHGAVDERVVETALVLTLVHILLFFFELVELKNKTFISILFGVCETYRHKRPIR